MKKFMNEREDLKEYVNEEVWDYGREISNSKKAIFTTFSPFFFAQRKLPKVTRLLASWRFSKAYRITVFENHRKSLIASEASYVYILIGQKFIKNAKNGQFWWSFWKPEACGQAALPDRSVLSKQKLVENTKIVKFKWDFLVDFKQWSII